MGLKIDQNLYAEAMKKALKVDSLKSSTELKLYTVSIYNAMMWGREVDEENKKIRKLNRSVK
nr:MAG TPA: hypothetical protein [Caudoviricetes sp.]